MSRNDGGAGAAQRISALPRMLFIAMPIATFIDQPTDSGTKILLPSR